MKKDTTMTMITKTAETLQDGIKNMMAAAKEDYNSWSSGGDGQSSYCKEQLDKWDSKTSIREGRKFIKIVQENSVFAFVCKTDFKHFKVGDVLKPAGFNAPALNQPRGNVLTGNYYIRWTGPLYLK